MVDTVRGVLRVRKWPKKRGTPKSASQRFWIDWFTQANRLAKYVDAASAIRAIELTAKSGLYPRDVLLAAMRGRLYHWVDETGWKWYSMAAIGDISESLDVLAQQIGSVLVRATDRWRSPPPGALDDVLTYKGDALPPVWQAPGGGGGSVQEDLAGTPIVCDDTVSQYDFDVSSYNTVRFMLTDVVFAANSQPFWLFSTDGGVSYHTGASDYRWLWVDHAGSGILNKAQFEFQATQTVTARRTVINFYGLRVTRATMQGMGERSVARAKSLNGYTNFDGPITDIRLLSQSAANFKTGTIYVVGER